MHWPTNALPITALRCAASDKSPLTSPDLPPLDDVEDSALWPWRWRLLLQIARFGLPALSIPLADPMMGLVDTLCIAQYSTTLALASLAPCTLIFNFITCVGSATQLLLLALFTQVHFQLPQHNHHQVYMYMHDTAPQCHAACVG